MIIKIINLIIDPIKLKPEDINPPELLYLFPPHGIGIGIGIHEDLGLLYWSP